MGQGRAARSAGGLARWFRARLDPLELLNAEGEVVARAGDWISVAGAEMTADPESPCMLGQERAFHVQDEMR